MAMRIDRLLNGGPSVPQSSSAYDPSPSSSAAAFTVKPHPTIETLIHHHPRSTSSTSSPSELLSHEPYSPYEQATSHSREPTISSRSSYSGPSLNPSTAATSPSEQAMPPLHVSNSSRKKSLHSPKENRDMTPSQSSSFSGRTLPSLTAIFSNMSTSLPPNGESAVSPHSSTPVYPYGPDTSYFASSYALAATMNSNETYAQYQPPHHYHPYQQHRHNDNNNSLMSFAEVATELGGRRNLELAAAAEVLTGRGGGTCTIRQAENVSDGAGYARDKSGNRGHDITDSGAVPNRPFLSDLDPALRPVSVGSLASTGRTIRVEPHDDNVDNHRNRPETLPVERASLDSAYDHEAPLFRPSPEPSPQPVQLTVDTNIAGPSNSGPLHIPSPSPHEFLSQPPKCSYCTVCTTNSPLRKVVSHIFGRNKLSTRQIPKNVWVYYCRKHYQRSRYRNPRGFARQQVLLVKRQCERLELWGGVKDWIIKVRRREELRMNREGENGEEVMEDVDDLMEDADVVDDDEPESAGPTSEHSSRRNSTAQGRRPSSVGGSNWMLRHTGTNKTIKDVYRLLDRIESEVQDNGGKFPDVELLPNVDLARAVSISLPEGDHSNGAHGDEEDGDDEGDEGGTAGWKGSKKRRRVDSASGSSGAEGNGKRAKGTKTKKGAERKGKGKTKSHAEIAPANQEHRNGPARNSELQGKRRGDVHATSQATNSQSESILKAHGQDEHMHGVNESFGSDQAPSRRVVSLDSTRNNQNEQQIATPPPSASASSRRSSPTMEEGHSLIPRTPSSQLGNVKSRQSEKSFAEHASSSPVYEISRRSLRFIPPSQPTYAHSQAPRQTRRNSAQVAHTPKQLAGIAGEPLHRFDFRRNETLVFGELIEDHQIKSTERKTSSVSDHGNIGTRRGRSNAGEVGGEVLDCITVANI
ncbi:hypothetical protein RUND412_007588 [Rhizina undulata]